MISYLKHTEIDKQKWDRCINSAPNGLVYACSWYLDIVCPGWAALVIGDYEIVMPLTAKRKFGFSYLFQPIYTQQLGVYSANNIELRQMSLILNTISKKYKLVDINLNYGNEIFKVNIQHKEQINYELHLNRSYEELYNHYSPSNKDSLKRAYKKDALEIRPNITISELIGLFTKTVPIKLSGNQVQILKNLHKEALSRGICELYGLFDKENRLVAASSFLHYKERLLFFTSISSEDGKKKRAMFQMLDFIIKKYAGNNLILDFEGSNIPGIARFFAGFGPGPTIYYGIKLNRLPAMVNYVLHVYRKLHS